MASESITIRAAALPDTAASVGVTDTAGHFVGTNVETVLAELADGTTLDGRYANATGDTFTGDVTVSKATPILRSTATTGNAHLILDATLGSYSIVQFFENGVQISYLIQRTGTGSFDLVKNGVVLKLLDDSEQFDASNAAAVIVPPASAATHAARVTAFDAALSPGTNGAAVEGSDATRDTGWRDMTVNASVVSSGNVHLRRVGDLVTWGLLCSTTGTGALLDATAHPNIPVGFRCKNRASIQVTDSGFTATTGIVGVATFTVPTLGARTAAGCYGTLSYTTTDAWPTSLPGVAA